MALLMYASPDCDALLLGSLAKRLFCWTSRQMVTFLGKATPLFSIWQWIDLVNNDGPNLRHICIYLKPFFKARLCIWQNCIFWTFGFTNTAIDAFVWVDDEHVLALIKTIYRTN